MTQRLQPMITDAQRRALTFLLEPWVANWWAGKPHGSWPKELNARSYDKLIADGLIKRQHVFGSAFRQAVKITPAGRTALKGAA